MQHGHGPYVYMGMARILNMARRGYRMCEAQLKGAEIKMEHGHGPYVT